MAFPIIPIIIGISFASTALALWGIRYTIEDVKEITVGDNGIFGGWLGKALIGAIATALVVYSLKRIK